MEEKLRALICNYQLCGDLKKDSIGLLNSFGKEVVSEHVLRVAAQAKELALQFNADASAAEIAGMLHDISVIVPNEERVKLAEVLKVDVLSEEKPYPFILHQKLSAALAKEIFSITDEGILSAISCHTTLKSKASDLDMIVFIADKLQWDQQGEPPYLKEVREGLEKSLVHAAYAFIHYLMQNQEKLLMVHPWLVQAYKDLEATQ